MKTRNYWIAVVGEGFIGNDDYIHYGSYEMVAKRFDTKEEAEMALYYIESDETIKVKFIK